MFFKVETVLRFLQSKLSAKSQSLQFPPTFGYIPTKFYRNIYQISPICFVSLGITTLYSHIYI